MAVIDNLRTQEQNYLNYLKGTTGLWQFDRTTYILKSLAAGVTFEIPLGTIRTASGMIAWIVSASKKSWATGKTLNELVDAFDFLFAPQCTFYVVSGGGQVTIDPINVIEGRIGHLS